MFRAGNAEINSVKDYGADPFLSLFGCRGGLIQQMVQHNQNANDPIKVSNSKPPPQPN